MTDDIDQTTREVVKMNEEIAAALRALVADGIVEKADFGNFLGLGVPPDIAKLLGDGPARSPRLRLTLQISAAAD